MNKYEIEGVKKYITINGYIEIETHGVSMFPTIKDGDKIIVSATNDSIKENDIIVFYYQDNSEDISLIAHRVIRIMNDKSIITKGDNNNIADRPIHKKSVIGKVISILAKGDR